MYRNQSYVGKFSWQSNDFVGCCYTDNYLDCIRNARCKIVPSKVNQSVLDIPKFLAVILVCAGVLRTIFGCCKHLNGKAGLCIFNESVWNYWWKIDILRNMTGQEFL